MGIEAWQPNDIATGDLVFCRLQPPETSTTGLTAEERRRLFLDKDAVSKNVDVAKNLRTFGCDLSLIEYAEWQRTKHVHRLHPYLGKFIPQLVELFLRRFFRPGDTVLDPFAGSGTTLVEANALGINAVGIELAPFNCLIARVKMGRYDINELRAEVSDALDRIEGFSRQLLGTGHLRFHRELDCDSQYLRSWFAPRALQEILFYRSIIPDYAHQAVLKVILSRSARSCRLIPHFDLARPKQPLKPDEVYYCRKHKRMCRPITEALKFLRRYSADTVRRIEEFSNLRTGGTCAIVQGDARTAPLPSELRLNGVFTSPPYVGMIDYHEQHRYAYELFPEYVRHDNQEIGPMSLGRSAKAKRRYVQDIVAVFHRLIPHLVHGAKVFIVANDRHRLYPDIIDQAGLRLVDVFHRPVPMRTERDTTTFFESIFCAEPRNGVS